VLVLAIDTSSPAVTAALVTTHGEVIAARSQLAARGHGELLAPSIAECLDAVGAPPGAVVAGIGPGPYTGLRVGLVTAAAFAHARGIPTYGVCSLDGIASQGECVVVTDARRREVYWAAYDSAGNRTDGPHVQRPADVETDVCRETWSALGHHDYFGSAWYEAQLPPMNTAPGKTVTLWLTRVDGVFQVWINGQAVSPSASAVPSGLVMEAHAKPMVWDISGKLRSGGPNVLQIATKRTKLAELGGGGLLGPVYIYQSQ